jgi:hypothetical protein
MDRAWSADDTITVRQVYGDLLRDREIAYTTVMTTVQVVHRHDDGGQPAPQRMARADATRLSQLAPRPDSGPGGGAVGH